MIEALVPPVFPGIDLEPRSVDWWWSRLSGSAPDLPQFDFFPRQINTHPVFVAGLMVEKSWKGNYVAWTTPELEPDPLLVLAIAGAMIQPDGFRLDLLIPYVSWDLKVMRYAALTPRRWTNPWIIVSSPVV